MSRWSWIRGGVARLGPSALNRKLIRDLIAMKGQALAIALVIAAGIAMFVAYLSNLDSLAAARETYYSRQRFADVFASATRVPARVEEAIRRLDGVAEVETRVVATVVLDVPGFAEPATGRLVSLPDSGPPALNDLHLRAGRWVSSLRGDEAIVSEAFFDAHGLALGDHVHAVINGRRRALTIVGVALSPEYLFSIRPGEIVPDAKRFGVLWMTRRGLASAFQMEGAFNDVSLLLAETAPVGGVVADVDRLLHPYGGLGAAPRALQMSNWALENELRQLETFGFFVPVIFLTVAAFVLNVAVARALALQRPQIAALKALGYTNRELAWHYVKWALAIAATGAGIGVVLGAWMGTAMLDLYREYFKFPNLTYRLSAAIAVEAAAVSLVAAALGVATAVRRAVAIAPAEAMRPDAPKRYRRSWIEAAWWRGRIPTAARMIARNLERQPVRAATTIVGIACAAAILQVGFSLIDAMDALITKEFSASERQHMTVNFVQTLSADAKHDLARLPGVVAIEPQRIVPVRLRSGHRSRTLAITALPATPDLKRPIGRDGRVVPPAASGLVLSAVLARVLDVEPGDAVTVEVLEGSQRVETVSVGGVVDDIFGLSAYMESGALHAFMREDESLTGASFLIDPAAEETLTGALKVIPTVAGVAAKRVLLENFRRTMAENIGVMLTFNVLFAGVIAFGVVYNAARVSVSERSRELASLRVLGFTRAEISLILLGELATLTLVALPVGALLGHGLTALLVYAFESEIYRFPLVVSARVLAWAALVVVAASLVSGLVVRRHLDRLDLVGVLKLRE